MKLRTHNRAQFFVHRNSFLCEWNCSSTGTSTRIVRTAKVLQLNTRLFWFVAYEANEHWWSNLLPLYMTRHPEPRLFTDPLLAFLFNVLWFYDLILFNISVKSMWMGLYSMFTDKFNSLQIKLTHVEHSNIEAAQMLSLLVQKILQ